MDHNKFLSGSARVISIVFHPLLIPTLGFLLFFYSGFYFAILPWALKKFIILVVFTSTCVLPALILSTLSLNHRLDLSMEKSTDRVLTLIICSAFYYIGYLLLKRIISFPIYSVFLIAAILIQVVLLPITMRWKISTHLAAIGGLIGGVFGLSLRLHENPVFILSFLIVVAGLLGTSRLILEKHTEKQVYAGFCLGFFVLFLITMFI
jgi:hypothetical protein